MKKNNKTICNTQLYLVVFVERLGSLQRIGWQAYKQNLAAISLRFDARSRRAVRAHGLQLSVELSTRMQN